MYRLGVKRDFSARHFLVGGDWGPENQPHGHHYVLELELAGDRLDHHGFLVDIVEVERHLDALVDRYRDQLLNDLPEFVGLNPSIEHFCRIVCQKLDQTLAVANLTGLTVRVWESDIAWTSYSVTR